MPDLRLYKNGKNLSEFNDFPLFNPKRKKIYTKILNLLYPIQLKEDQTQDVLSSLPDLEKHLYPKKRILSIRQLLDSSVD